MKILMFGTVLFFFIFSAKSEENSTDLRNQAAERWKNGPPKTVDFFPIAVWLQDPRNALKYKAVGFNVYVGLWEGPTEEQLSALSKAGMKVICEQNAVGLGFKDPATIIGWMHGDEPDNAQELKGGKGYGPPILPAKIVEEYERMRKADPTRPVLLNLGQGVAYDNYIGRGVRRNKLEDYPEYIKGCDIVSFDIYPVTHDTTEIAGKLWYVAKGVDRLRKWGDEKKDVWDCIECTHIGNPQKKPTAAEVKSIVWMSLIHGARGLVYFAHEFKPKFIEAGLLADAAMTQAVTAINTEIRELAPVLNSPTEAAAASVQASSTEAPIDILVKRCQKSVYIFAAAMRGVAGSGEFKLAADAGAKTVEVLGEGRSLEVKDGKFSDAFGGYAVHLYRVR